MAFAGKRRILIIVENLPVPFDRRVWNEACALRDAGYDVSVICPEGRGYAPGHEVLEDIHIWRHPLPWEADGKLGYIFEYTNAFVFQTFLACVVFVRRGFDVIHACNPPDLIFLTAALFRPLGKKFVFDHHDLNPELFEAKFGHKGLLYKGLLLMERLTFALASKSIATNESYARIARERGKMKPRDVTVVRSGPKLERMKIMPPQDKYRNGRKHLVGYVGVMGKQEGLDILLRAAKRIVKDKGRDDVQFHLVGGGTELAPLQAYAEELGIADHVTFAGRVPDEPMLAALNTADVCVNPDVPNALNDLSTMNKIMEYMALGKPIVQFDLKEGRFSAGEASLYAENGNEADFADKILELIDDKERAKAMGEWGRNRVINELAWTYEAPKLLAAYDSLFAERPRRMEVPFRSRLANFMLGKRRA